jgi:Cu/Ag efflux protein CusF
MRSILVCLLLLQAESTAPEERYQLRGEVVSVNRDEQSVRIKHEEIKGWMDAMTMDFPIKEKSEMDKIKPGDQITATVFVNDLKYHVGDIHVLPAKP